MVPIVAYVFQPSIRESGKSLGSVYLEVFGIYTGNNRIDEVATFSLVLLIPYFLYQFGRSIVWAYRATK